MPTRPNKNETMGCDTFEDILDFFQASPSNLPFPDMEINLKDIVGMVEDTSSVFKELTPQSQDLSQTCADPEVALLARAEQ